LKQQLKPKGLLILLGFVVIVNIDGEEEETMNDERSKSLSEAFVNSFGSYPIGYGIGIIILPLFSGWLQKEPFTVAIFITLIYASVSFVRTYYLRRVFERFGFDDNLVVITKKMLEKLHRNNLTKLDINELNR